MTNDFGLGWLKDIGNYVKGLKDVLSLKPDIGVWLNFYKANALWIWLCFSIMAISLLILLYIGYKKVSPEE